MIGQESDVNPSQIQPITTRFKPTYIIYRNLKSVQQ